MQSYNTKNATLDFFNTGLFVTTFLPLSVTRWGLFLTGPKIKCLCLSSITLRPWTGVSKYLQVWCFKETNTGKVLKFSTKLTNQLFIPFLLLSQAHPLQPAIKWLNTWSVTLEINFTKFLRNVSKVTELYKDLVCGSAAQEITGK
jgi:hypothetical protein